MSGDGLVTPGLAGKRGGVFSEPESSLLGRGGTREV